LRRCSREQLVEGEPYFSVIYVDDEMVKPTLLSLVFIGRNLEPGGTKTITTFKISSRTLLAFDTPQLRRRLQLRSTPETSLKASSWTTKHSMNSCDARFGGAVLLARYQRSTRGSVVVGGTLPNKALHRPAENQRNRSNRERRRG